MTYLTLDSPKINYLATTSLNADVSALIRRLQVLPKLTEAEAGFLNVAGKVIERASSSPTPATLVSAITIAERVADMARRVSPVVVEGAFARSIWTVEKRPQLARNGLYKWIIPSERPVDGGGGAAA